MWTRQQITDNFPLEGRAPRFSQVVTVEAILDSFLNRGKRFVILQSPVGSGKSAIAMSLAKYFGSSHVLTPRKPLQDQYFSDFQHMAVTMKGRSSYPCVYLDNSEYELIRKFILRGESPPAFITERNCAQGRCSNGNKEVYEACSRRQQCPYSLAMGVAQQSNHILHNFHSFIFQAYMGDKFDKRPLMVIDEAHRLRNTLPDFLSRQVFARGIRGDSKTPADGAPIDEWCDWFSQEEFVHKYSTKVDREDYLDRIASLRMGMRGREYVIERKVLDAGTRFTFRPLYLGQIAEEFLFQFADKILLMSGTIYSKDAFCDRLGINPEEADFLDVDSSFPVKIRPVIVKPDYLVPTSHKDKDMRRIRDVVKTILDRAPDKKGLIHVPSYEFGRELISAMPDEPRLLGHASDNTQETLDKFFQSEQALVLVSPVCTEGVDFKDDRARFQIVCRVPYPNVGDPWVKAHMERSRNWFNLEALTVFGQMLGRVNRHDDDYGVTVLIDERFPDFIRRNKHLIPEWQYKAFIFR